LKGPLSVAILGSTGSVGRQTLDVIRRMPERFRVVALAGGSNHTLLEDQAREFHPDLVCCQTAERHMEIKAAAGRRARWATILATSPPPKCSATLKRCRGR
jgi:1-deoxy-D-xylulose 5-phosphate reductoisomerase